MRIITLIIISLLFVHPIKAQLYLNEFAASNDSILADEFGEFDDWIELYNNSEDSVYLAGLYLTDDLQQSQKWNFPDTCLAGHQFLLVWADGDSEQGKFHTNFKLDGEGEQLGLFDGTDFLDSLTYVKQTTDISFGRSAETGTGWYFFSEPTPGSQNSKPNPPIAEKPAFSPPGCFFSDNITVELTSNDPDGTIYFTLDGSEPTDSSIIFTSPITTDTTIVIRARTYHNGYTSSPIVTYTYIKNQTYKLPTLSLVTDPINLWSEHAGIYLNYDEEDMEWERPVAVEFFDEQRNPVFNEDSGIRIHGGGPRRFPKKAFRLYFRNQYGKSWLNYQLFPSKRDINKYKRFIIHAGSSDMADNEYSEGWTLIRDPMMHEFCRRLNGVYSATRPVALFLNGQPWGIYNLFERTDRFFIEANYGDIDVDIIEDGNRAREGDMDSWMDMFRYIKFHNLENNDHYQIAKTYIDIENYIDYNVLEIFSGNRDWPHNNQLAFRIRKPGERWRWILWDVDAGFIPYGLYFDTLDWASRDHETTVIFRKLLENSEFRNAFIVRFTDLMNTMFSPENVISMVDSFASVIRDDITFETNRWGSSPEEWEQAGLVGELYDFANKRPGFIHKFMQKRFSLSRPGTLIIAQPQGGLGKVRVNTVEINWEESSSDPWQGLYYRSIPIELKAIPEPGYKFVRWSDSSQPDSSRIRFSLPKEYTIYPIFEKMDYYYQLVINEINYNSSKSLYPNGAAPKDWIEIYNYSTEQHSAQEINMAGWHFKDEDNLHDFIFPDNTIIQRDSFLIVCMDTIAFQNQFPTVTNYVGNFDFGLSSNGELIQLYDSNGILVDSLTYSNQAPWPTEADGNGATLELKAPTLDKALPENWQAGINGGSPGSSNPSRKKYYIAVAPDTLKFCFIKDRVQPFTKYVMISDTAGTGQLNWSAVEIIDKEWLALSSSDGVSGEQLKVTVDISGLEIGTYLSSIRITGTGAINNPVVLPVKLIVTQKSDWAELIQLVPDDSSGLGEKGWKLVNQAGKLALMSVINSSHANEIPKTQQDQSLNYSIEIPIGIDTIYLFAETYPGDTVGITTEGHSVFGIQFNQESVNYWKIPDNFDRIWTKNWIIDPETKTVYSISVKSGLNSLNLYPGEPGGGTPRGYVSLLGVTANPEFDLEPGNITIISNSKPENQLEKSLPVEFRLLQNYPNPFNPITALTFDIPQNCQVEISIFNQLGQRVKKLVEKNFNAGTHQIHWDGTNTKGDVVTNGIYFGIFKAGRYSQFIKMILLK